MKIIQKLSLKKVKFIAFQFVDLNGNIKQITVPKQRLNYIKKNGLFCDGSSVFCGKSRANSDIQLYVDKDSYFLFPDGKQNYFCLSKTNFDCRSQLKQIEDSISKKNLYVKIGAELEFFLFENENFLPTDKSDYMNTIEDKYNLCFCDIVECAQKNDISIEAFHHECANNQFEIDFKFDTPLKTADRIIFLKQIIGYFANKYKLFACFLPKPIKNQSGSGMHTNISVWHKNKNLFFDANDKNKISETAKNFAKNIFKHIGALTAFSSPTQNGYKRIFSNFETPKKIDIVANDRNALIRIPKASKNSARLEFRLPDISCNPYLLLSAILTAGFDNEPQNKLTLSKMSIPTSLEQSLKLLKNDKLLGCLVPKDYFKNNNYIKK